MERSTAKSYLPNFFELPPAPEMLPSTQHSLNASLLSCQRILISCPDDQWELFGGWNVQIQSQQKGDVSVHCLLLLQADFPALVLHSSSLHAHDMSMTILAQSSSAWFDTYVCIPQMLHPALRKMIITSEHLCLPTPSEPAIKRFL